MNSEKYASRFPPEMREIVKQAYESGYKEALIDINHVKEELEPVGITFFDEEYLGRVQG